MKIGIMGAQCSGKSELAAELGRAYSPMAIVLNEGAQECPYPINQGMTLKSQRWIMARQIAMEHYAEGGGVVVCDRTVLDPVVYAMWMLDATNHRQWVEFLDMALPFALDWYQSYDTVIWCRPDGSPPVDNGRRDIDPDFQVQVDAVFARVVTGFNLKCISPEEIDSVRRLAAAG